MSETARMRAVEAPIIPVVADLIRRHPGTISLGQGVVSWGPPAEVAARLAGFPDDLANHRYQAVEGVPALREAIARKLADENGIVVDQGGSAVLVTAGANMAFLHAVLAIADPGDEVVLLAPYYFNQHMAVALAGCRPVVIDTDDRFTPRLDALAAGIGPRTRAVVTVSPNNPTGAVYSPQLLRAISGLCAERGVYHVHDETYEYFTWDGARAFSPGGLPGAAAHTISLFSLSKAYGFASWRIGYMVAPSALLPALRKIQDTNIICPPVISQHAALGALHAGRAWCAKRLAGLAEVRRVVQDALGGLSDHADVPNAEGAFYVLVRLRTLLDPMLMVERLVREHGVAAIPGTAFGVHRGCTMRLSYGALDTRTAGEGIGRFVEGVRRILG